MSENVYLTFTLEQSFKWVLTSRLAGVSSLPFENFITLFSGELRNFYSFFAGDSICIYNLATNFFFQFEKIFILSFSIWIHTSIKAGLEF